MKENDVFSNSTNQLYLRESNQAPQPFLGQTSHHPFISPQTTQEKIMEIKSVIMGLNQKMMDLEKCAMQI